MKIEMVDPAQLTPYENNPRNNDDAVPAVKASIAEFGFRNPILAKPDGEVIAGHTRLKAALELGLKEVPVIYCGDLTDEQCRALRLADNKTGELAEWILPMLDVELSEIEGIDMSQFGFEMPDMDLDESFGMGMGDGSEDDVPDVEEVEPTVKRGQIWRLGDHVLMCGDSTVAKDVDRLMQGERAEMCFTSPPYNAGHLDLVIKGEPQVWTQKKYLGDDDQKPEDEYTAFLIEAVKTGIANSQEAFFNIGMLAGSKRPTIDLLHTLKDVFKDVVYWEKANPMSVQLQHCVSQAIEPIWVFGEGGTRRFRKDIGYFTGVVHGYKQASDTYSDIHKATFPLYLPLEMVQTFTDPGETVLDLFGGTGTTLIACEQTGRRCRMMELDPRYCDVIIARWERLTGRKAELVGRRPPTQILYAPTPTSEHGYSIVHPAGAAHPHPRPLPGRGGDKAVPHAGRGHPAGQRAHRDDAGLPVLLRDEGGGVLRGDGAVHRHSPGHPVRGGGHVSLRGAEGRQEAQGMSDWESIGMVVVALGSILGLVAAISGPLVKLNSAIARLETVLTSLQEKMTEAGSTLKALDARVDRVETTLTEHGMRVERLEEECARRKGI